MQFNPSLHRIAAVECIPLLKDGRRVLKAIMLKVLLTSSKMLA